jgi:hypothetical protein
MPEPRPDMKGRFLGCLVGCAVASQVEDSAIPANLASGVLGRVQFTMRRLMVAVAVLAMVMGAIEGLRRRRESFERRAKMFAQKVSDAYIDEQNYRMSHRSSRFGYDGRTTQAYYQLVEYYSALQEKYEKAVARPWHPVAPDPPAPAWPKDVPRHVPWMSVR